MASMKVSIFDHTDTNKTGVEMPDDLPMARLLPVLVNEMGLPLQQGGRPIVYRLIHRRTGNVLSERDTLRSANVQADDALTLVPELTAGSRQA
jgi:hypothetical protein